MARQGEEDHQLTTPLVPSWRQKEEKVEVEVEVAPEQKKEE